MQLYIDYSAKIYGIYLRYVSKEDIHVYSVDECFIDVTNYLSLYHLSEKEMALELMKAVMDETGITATAGVGTNLYLAKIAMDIVAKHVDDSLVECGASLVLAEYSLYLSLLILFRARVFLPVRRCLCHLHSSIDCHQKT